MAELHIVGQLVGASDFTLPSLFCKFSFEAGANFRLLQGQTAGQTQCDMPPVGPRFAFARTGASTSRAELCTPYRRPTRTCLLLWTPQEGEMALLAHPLDVHYAVKGVDGWPRLRLEVYGVDAYGRVDLAGYGCCIVPTAAGSHELRCATWRPCGSLREQFSSAPRQRIRPFPRQHAYARTRDSRDAQEGPSHSFDACATVHVTHCSQPSSLAAGRGSSKRS